MAGRVSVEDDESSGQPSTSKTTEYFDKIREFIHEDRRRTIHVFADAVGLSYGVCQEILRICAAFHLHYHNAPAHKSLKTTEFVPNKNMLVVPHPSYSPELAPCYFALFPN
jgi:transposase